MSSLAARAGLAAIALGIRLPEVRVEQFRQHARTAAEIRRQAIDLVVDVGANRGFYSKHLRMAGYRGEILAFEPEPDAFTRLERAANGDPHWHVFDFALGDAPGELAFNIIRVGEETVLSSLLEPRGDYSRASVRVTVRRLADVLRERSIGPDRRIFLKMDTQGFDLKVFAGCDDDARIRLLQSEVSVVPLYEDMPHYTDALRSYEGAGFELLDLYVVNRTDGGSVLELDALMTRGRSASRSAETERLEIP